VSDSEISAVLGELGELMGELRASVTALQAILTESPEVPGAEPATA
jgi:hypothetical protein